MKKIFKILFEPDRIKLKNPYNFIKNDNTAILIVTNDYKKYLNFIYSYYNYTIISYNFFNIIKKDFKNVFIDNFKFYYKNDIIDNLRYRNKFIFNDLQSEYEKIDYKIKEKEYRLFFSDNIFKLNNLIKNKDEFDFREILELFYKKILFFGFENKKLDNIHKKIIKNKIIQKDYAYIKINNDKWDTFKLKNKIVFKKHTSIAELINIYKPEYEKYISLFIDPFIYKYYKLLFNIINLYINEFSIEKYKRILNEISSIYQPIK